MKLLLVTLLIASNLWADLLYETEFDDFTTGANQWSANASWLSNDTTSGAQSIDADVLPALLKTASLGFARPALDFTFVALDLGYDHVASGAPIVEIDTLIGIENSTNNRRDDFFISIYNSSGNPLASIRFDNQDPADFNSQFGIWRENGTNQFDTLVDFISSELFNLFVTIDLENNTWSADIGGIPLFEDAQFTNTDAPVDFGFLAFEWDLTSTSTLGYGDNFLLVADVAVRSVTATPDPGLLVTHSFYSQNDITLSWKTAVGWDDQVQYSSDLVTWRNTLPNSTFGNITSSSTVNYTETNVNKGPVRFYRVLRTPTS
tara:strand:- start:116 stop:1072 length:957 start_codon:yes stop_codon:yes gene_type:complete